MASAFVSRSPAPQSKEQKKISSLAQRPSKAANERAKSGKCVVLYRKPDMVPA